MIEIVGFFRNNATAIVALLIWLAGVLLENSHIETAKAWINGLSPRRKFAFFFILTMAQAIGIGIYQAWPFSFSSLPVVIWDAIVVFIQQQALHMVYSRQKFLYVFEDMAVVDLEKRID